MKRFLGYIGLFFLSAQLQADCRNCLVPHAQHHASGVHEWIEKKCLAITSDDCFYQDDARNQRCLRCHCLRTNHTDKRNLHEYDANGAKITPRNIGTVSLATLLPNGRFAT